MLFRFFCTILHDRLSNMQRVDPITIIVYLEVDIFLQEFSAMNFFVKEVIAKRVFTEDRMIVLLLFAVDELV